ncbi:MAG: hypothetical protein NC078_09915 [Ruminococcus sp.]|nr:hypothetical protein [Ruminococcus sp.]
MSERYNGGITLGIGNYKLKYISSYEPKWTHEYDSGASFESYKFEKISAYKGRRFSANVTSTLPDSEAQKLMNALYAHRFEFTSPEFSGLVEITSVSKPYKKSNRYGTFVTVNFSLAAVGLLGGSGSL